MSPPTTPPDAPRAARLEDIPGIYNLLKHFSDRGLLLPRSEHDLYQNLREFFVLEQADEIIACAALQIFTAELGEARSLAVAPRFAAQGVGKKLMHSVEQAALQLGLRRIMALTYATEFFHKLGYQTVAMEELPEKVWGVCINCKKFLNCDEIAVLKYLR